MGLAARAGIEALRAEGRRHMGAFKKKKSEREKHSHSRLRTMADPMSDVGRVLVDVQRELSTLRQSISLPSIAQQQQSMFDGDSRGDGTSSGATGRVSLSCVCVCRYFFPSHGRCRLAAPQGSGMPGVLIAVGHAFGAPRVVQGS